MRDILFNQFTEKDDQCPGKMSLPLLPEPLMSPLQVEQNSTDRTDAGGLWPPIAASSVNVKDVERLC